MQIVDFMLFGALLIAAKKNNYLSYFVYFTAVVYIFVRAMQLWGVR